MRARPRCPRGHFLPAPGDTCRCALTRRRRARFSPDLWGQRLPARTITTIPLTGSYL